MAKTVTIPAGDNPFICKINDVYYSYPAGATVEVPDEVAALIQANAGNREKSNGLSDIAIPRDGAVDDVLTRTADGAEWATPTPELPAVTADDNGDVLTVVEGAWAPAAPSGGSNVLLVNYDVDTHTLDKTWKEIHDAEYAVITGAAGSDKFVMHIAGFHAGEGGYDVNAYAPYYDGDEGTVGFDSIVFNTDSEDGYPVLDTGD